MPRYLLIRQRNRNEISIKENRPQRALAHTLIYIETGFLSDELFARMKMLRA